MPSDGKSTRPRRTLVIDDWMSPIPKTVEPNQSVSDALGLMRAGAFKHLPVVQAGKLIGMIAMEDIRVAYEHASATHRGEDPSGEDVRPRVYQYMRQPVATVAKGSSIAATVRQMKAARVGSLIVMDEDQVAGIVTKSDMLNCLEYLIENLAELQSSGADMPGTYTLPGAEDVEIPPTLRRDD